MKKIQLAQMPRKNIFIAFFFVWFVASLSIIGLLTVTSGEKTSTASLAAPNQSAACTKANGVCGNPNNCKGDLKRNICPGGTNNVCCITQSKACTDAGGKCGNPNNCNGDLKRNICPGGNDNVCCVPKKISGPAPIVPTCKGTCINPSNSRCAGSITKDTCSKKGESCCTKIITPTCKGTCLPASQTRSCDGGNGITNDTCAIAEQKCCVKAAPAPTCKGTCINVSTSRCAGPITKDTCSKAGEQCCTSGAATCDSVKGSCIDTTKFSCSVSTSSETCTTSGQKCCKGTTAAIVQPKPTLLDKPAPGQSTNECVSKKGTCYDAKKNRCTGQTKTFAERYMCPGGYTIVCCATGKVTPLTDKDKKDSACERINGTCADTTKYTCSSGFKADLCSGTNNSCCREKLTCKKGAKDCPEIDEKELGKQRCKAMGGSCLKSTTCTVGGGTIKAGVCQTSAAHVQDVCCIPKAPANACTGDAACLDSLTQSCPGAGFNDKVCVGANMKCCPNRVIIPLSVKATLQGVGPDQYVYTTKVQGTIKAFIYDPSVTTQSRVLGTFSAASTDTLTYDPPTGNFLNPAFKLQDIPAGNYQLVLQVDGYLDAQLLNNDRNNIFSLTPATAVTSYPVHMIAGDVGPTAHGDNVIDIIDWNLVVGCYHKSSTGVCKSADLNKDNVIDELDQQILIPNIGRPGFSTDIEEIVCGADPACQQGKTGLQMCQLICAPKKVR